MLFSRLLLKEDVATGFYPKANIRFKASSFCEKSSYYSGSNWLYLSQFLFVGPNRFNFSGAILTSWKFKYEGRRDYSSRGIIKDETDDELLNYFARMPQNPSKREESIEGIENRLESKPNKTCVKGTNKLIQTIGENDPNYSRRKESKHGILKGMQDEKSTNFEWVSYKIGHEDCGTRLDKFILKNPNLSKVFLYKLLRKKKIMIGDYKEKKLKWRRVDLNHKLELGSRVKIELLKKDIPKSNSQNNRSLSDLSNKMIEKIRSCVIYKDDEIIVINKPADLAVQGGTKTTISLDDLLPALAYEKDHPPLLVHRLDKGVTGILVLARSRKVARILAKDFSDSNVRKLYWAVCLGVPERLAGSIKVLLGKFRVLGDDYERVYVIDSNDFPMKHESVVEGENEFTSPFKKGKKNPPGKISYTKYHTISHTHKYFSLMALRPLTGRTHQLRVHCSQVLKIPILGDEKYGVENYSNFNEIIDLNLIQNIHLHSREIAFNHPISKKPFHIKAPLPPYFTKTLNSLSIREDSIDSKYSVLNEKERALERLDFVFNESPLKRKKRIKAKKEIAYKLREKDKMLKIKLKSAPKKLRAVVGRFNKERKRGNSQRGYRGALKKLYTAVVKKKGSLLNRKSSDIKNKNNFKKSRSSGRKSKIK